MILFNSKILCEKVTRFLYRRSSLCISPPPPTEPIVTLLDSVCPAGQSLALLLKQNPHIKELRLYDDEKSTYEISQDLCTIDTRSHVRSFKCKSLRDAIKGAHVVISFGGCHRKPGQSQEELFLKNLDSVRNAALFLAEFNPTAVYCIAKPPVEALVPMASEEYKRADSYDPGKIIGVTTFASMIANTFIARHLKTDPAQVLCPVIGGTSPRSTIPIISQTRPNVEYNSKVYAKLQKAISNAEEDSLKMGGLCFSRVAAVSRFINLLLRALKGDQNCVECAFVAQTGHIGELLPYMTSIVKLGYQGVSSTHMPKTNELETTLLKAAVPHILEDILLGQTFLSGDLALPPELRAKKVCDELLKDKLKECKIHTNVERVNSK